MKVHLNKSVTYGVPVLDDKGKPVPKSKVVFRDREHMVDLVDHVTLAARTTVDLPAALAKELIDRGHARAADSLLDDEGEGDLLK